MSKFKEKKKAIKLRKKGFSYNEILKEVSVAKSTLSLWLRGVGLAERMKQKLTKKRAEAQKKGAQARREQRIRITEEIKKQARREIGRISDRELWLIGTALYWAEGAKERERGSCLEICNSDVLMIKLFLKWVDKLFEVAPGMLRFELFVHENHKNRLREIKKHWAEATGLPIRSFETVYFKKHKPKTNRKNIGNNYYGVLKVKLRSSFSLNRRVAGWIEGICQKTL